ncbi:MAG TPA: hypothetical protein VM573_07370, partial [Actinomycetota bacterium]|nr:hypothetical protein [Actinomycetota bacterium]
RGQSAEMVSVASEPTVLYDASLAPWIIALPAASAAILLLFGRRIGGAIAGWIATLSVAAGSAMIHGARLAS